MWLDYKTCYLKVNDKQVEEKVSKLQRNYMLQEQLKIIKRELGIEVGLA